MDVVRAELGILPIVVLWVVAVIASKIQKAKKQAERDASQRALQGSSDMPRGLIDNRAESPAETGMMAELRRAMEELKRAEMQTEARERADDGETREPPVRAPHTTRPASQPPRATNDADARAQRYLQARQRVDASKPHTSTLGTHTSKIERRSMFQSRPSASDDEGSQETGSLEERTDYDDESIRTADERAAATALAWHAGEAAGHGGDLTAAEAAPRVPRKNPLAKYADGTAKSALVLSMILGRPPGEPDA